jgi:polyisoprenoid-binding protein YceI
MKTMFNLIALIALMGTFTACNNAPKGEKVDAGDAVETTENASAQAASYAVSTSDSKINWTGSKLVGDQHNGHIAIKEGNLKVQDGNIVGGTFVIDMNSITDEDLQAGQGKEKLEGHLKSADFFDVANHPTATFEIASVETANDNPEATHKITGNLTLRGETKSVTIPAKVSMADGQITATTPQFVIDRTQWGANYGASMLGVAQDKVIRDEIGLVIDLKAKS